MNFSSLALKASEALKGFPFIRNFARRIYCIFRPGMRFSVEQNFRDFDQIFVLKIGANDGVENDPIADFLLNDKRYRGVLVEPIPVFARMLSANYEGTGRFKVEQAAIGAKDGACPMYYVDTNATDSKGQPLPTWLRGVASLDRTHVEKHLLPEMYGAIVETKVDCFSIAGLLARNGIQKVDLLQIDAEGYDYIVLKQFDFSTLRPKVVIFEKKHLSNEDASAARAMMLQAGYEVKNLETDFLCVATNAS
jgi:FkbM family methyltransferase